MSDDSKRLIPKHPDGKARIAAIGRLSKPKPTDDETTETIESSFAVVKGHLKNIYDEDAPMDLRLFAEQESGLIADRATILEVEELIASGELDLVIAEDLSRIYRSPRHQHVFVDDCVDAGVRLICVADLLDTADENWETAMGIASLRHSMPIVDTRRRQKRKNHFAFHKGGNVQKIRFGYRKLTKDEAASGKYGPVGLRMAKVSEYTSVIKRMRELLMTPINGSYSWVPLLQYLRDERVPVGPYVKNGKWTQPMARDLLTDPILFGKRRFRTTLCTRLRGTGQFRREVNPNGPEIEVYSELAHLTEKEFDTMQDVIKKIADSHRSSPGADNPLYRRPSKDALFPRQHATCSVCEGLMYAYNSGDLKCENAHEHGEDQCWNHVQVDMEIARQKFVSWLVQQIDGVHGLRRLIADFAVSELAELRAKVQQGGKGRRATIAQLEREAANIARAIRTAGDVDSLAKEAKEIAEQLRNLREEEKRSAAKSDGLPECSTHQEVDQQLEEVLMHIASTSCEFANFMREIIPQFEIVPVQAIDSGLVRARARITLSVEQLRPESGDDPPVPDTQVELNLFEPPKHFRHINACLEIKRRDPKLSYVKIANAVSERLAKQRKEGEEPESISYMTVKRCFGIARQMEAEGLTEPYRILTEKPERASRWKPRKTKTGNA